LDFCKRSTLNFSKRGVRQTTGLPGSGTSHTSYLFKYDDEEDDKKETKKEERVSEDAMTSPGDEAQNRRHRPGAFSSSFLLHFSFSTVVQMPSVFFSQIFSQTFYRY
jgi:hypothetical protein